MRRRKQETDPEVLEMQQKYSKNDKQILKKKNELLQKELALQKQKQKALKNQLNQYRKLVFNSAQKDIHSVLQMQHQKIVQLQTSLEVLQNKYDKLLSSTSSNKETQYAIKCKELEKRFKESEMEYQKQISALKMKMMKVNASELYEGSQRQSTPSNSISPITRAKKLV